MVLFIPLCIFGLCVVMPDPIIDLIAEFSCVEFVAATERIPEFHTSLTAILLLLLVFPVISYATGSLINNLGKNYSRSLA